MEHYKSTFAVTGIAVLGLLTAAGILHPGNFERQAQPTAQRSAAAVATTAWVDPPASRTAQRRAAPLSDTAALMKPEPSVPLSADYAMVQPLPAGLTIVATTARGTRVIQGAKMARRAVPTRQTALNRPVAGDASAAQQQSSAESAGRTIDPIGDLMRGLGLTDRS
jgi:hypothetical protein